MKVVLVMGVVLVVGSVLCVNALLQSGTKVVDTLV